MRRIFVNIFRSVLDPDRTGTDLTVLALTDAEAVKRERRPMENFIFVHF
jgi:hypothetical protein